MEVTFMSWYGLQLSIRSLFLTLFLFWAEPELGIAEAPQAAIHPSFTVLVYNNAGVAPKTLNKSADLAKKIFSEAGLDMVWIQFDPQHPVSREELDQVELIMRILPGARSALSPGA